MTKLVLSIDINAPRETVWDAIIQDESYRKWSGVFYQGSYFEGGWNQGDAIHFVALDEDGNKAGMISEIAESIHPEFISIRHLGNINNGVIDTTSDDVRKWAPSYENYKLERLGENQTRFHLDMDAHEDYYAMFENLWPKAMAMLKDVCEETVHGPGRITVIALVAGEEGKVWSYWTNPDQIKEWNAASDDWECTYAENDVRAGGKFKYTMAAKDGSMSFDFAGEYTAISYGHRIDFRLDDGRHAEVYFNYQGDKICVMEVFDAESTNSPEMQRMGWQAILDNFKKYVEEN